MPRVDQLCHMCYKLYVLILECTLFTFKVILQTFSILLSFLHQVKHFVKFYGIFVCLLLTYQKQIDQLQTHRNEMIHVTHRKQSNVLNKLLPIITNF